MHDRGNVRWQEPAGLPLGHDARRYGSAIQNGLDITHLAGLTIEGLLLAAAVARLFERRDVL